MMKLPRVLLYLIIISAWFITLYYYYPTLHARLNKSHDVSSKSKPTPKPLLRNVIIECRFPDSGSRLGNHMFNFAAVHGTALRYRANATYLSISKYLLKVFKLSSSNQNQCSSEYTDTFRPRWTGNYDSRIEHFINTSAINKNECYKFAISGYFQSRNYFANFEREIKSYFTFKDQIISKAKQFLKDTDKFTKVGVHIRRTDYVANKKMGFVSPGPEYYKTAVKYFNKRYKNVLYVVCSDDIRWSKKNFPVKKNNVRFSEGHSAPVDLAILSLCDHMIVSVGSFGWWAAFLVNGTTTYFKGWPVPGSVNWDHFTQEDYFYPHWIPL